LRKKARQIKALSESLEDAGYGGHLKNILGAQLPMLLEKHGGIEDLRKHPTHNIKTIVLFLTIM
jgi:hypothetical protein